MICPPNKPVVEVRILLPDHRDSSMDRTLVDEEGSLPSNGFTHPTCEVLEKPTAM